MCSTPDAPPTPPPPPAPAPPTPPPILDMSGNDSAATKTAAAQSRGIKALRIDRTAANIGGAGGGLNIPA